MYVELHSASAFSFLEGASVPEELAAVCAEQGMEAMAVVDRDGVYGAPRFHLAMKKAGLKAHIGAEVTFHVSSFTLQDGRRRLGSQARATRETRNVKPETCVLPVLVSNREGYQNLCRLVTRMKARGPKDAPAEAIAATEADLQEHARGLSEPMPAGDKDKSKGAEEPGRWRPGYTRTRPAHGSQ
jgi:error-prone DNA polymerase